MELVSTSRQSALVSPCPLRDANAQYRFQFEPMIVNNEERPQDTVRGKLVYEKKRKHDPLFPTEQPQAISKRNIHVGDSLELQLSSGETGKLYECLDRLYRLADTLMEFPPGRQPMFK